MKLSYINEVVVESNDPKHVCDAMYRFWRYQYEQAKIQYRAAVGGLEAAHRANKEALDEWKRSDDLGFGYPQPFSSAELKRMESCIAPAKKNLEEVEAMYNYFMNYLFDRAHDGQTKST